MSRVQKLRMSRLGRPDHNACACPVSTWGGVNGRSGQQRFQRQQPQSRHTHFCFAEWLVLLSKLYAPFSIACLLCNYEQCSAYCILRDMADSIIFSKIYQDWKGIYWHSKGAFHSTSRRSSLHTCDQRSLLRLGPFLF
jgi:hypothetical protein